jgi:hypothetical protein
MAAYDAQVTIAEPSSPGYCHCPYLKCGFPCSDACHACLPPRKHTRRVGTSLVLGRLPLAEVHDWSGPWALKSSACCVAVQAKQAALRQQLQAQQRQEVMRLLSTLTPEQREQLSRLPPAAQVQYRQPPEASNSCASTHCALRPALKLPLALLCRPCLAAGVLCIPCWKEASR